MGDQERFDVLTFNSLKAQKKMVNDDSNKTLILALNEFAVDVNASVDARRQPQPRQPGKARTRHRVRQSVRGMTAEAVTLAPGPKRPLHFIPGTEKRRSAYREGTGRRP